MDENRVLGQEVGGMQHELELLNAQVEGAEAELRRDRVRDEYALMDKKVGEVICFFAHISCMCVLASLSPLQMTHLRREKASLDDEMSATRLDPAEARDKLLGKVKEDNARIQTIDRALRQAEEDNVARRKAILVLLGTTHLPHTHTHIIIIIP
jgi:hypothetical protein